MHKVIVMMSLILCFGAFAESLPLYQSKVGGFSRVLGPTRAALINTTATATGASVLTTALGTFSGIALASTGAGISAVGAVFGVAALRKWQYAKVIRLIDESRYGDGKYLRRLKRQMRKRYDLDVTLDELSVKISEMNQDESLSSYNPRKGKVELLTYRKLRKQLAETFGGSEYNEFQVKSSN